MGGAYMAEFVTVPLAALGFGIGLFQYRKAQKWKSAEFGNDITKLGSPLLAELTEAHFEKRIKS
jgi:hypothetical protein